MNTRPVAIFYEHANWFKPLFEELQKRSIPFVRINANEHTYNPAEREVPYSILINRVSSTASSRYIGHVERLGTPVLNGTQALEIESKAKQLELLASLGMPFPKTRIVNHVSQVIPAARGLRFPIVIKVNLASGQGIRKFSHIESLQRAVELDQVNLGVDNSAIVQEYIQSHEDDIVRVETLNGKFLYALKGSNRPEAYSPPDQVVRDVEVIAKAARLDAGSVEYVIDSVTGHTHYTNISSLSGFVPNPHEVLGFDPTVSFVDYIEERLWPNYELEPVLID
ncbi:MAG TPA: hypothetical protein VFE50_10280 [Cyclobacteriaceae bacterium]|nr:hypothetical protein [Cyclobacteriaceae bacterium]